MSIRKAGQVIAGTPNITTGHHVGEIFWTSRLDNELNGAVEANGAVYSVEAFTGEHSVPELLADGLLPYVSMTEYESIVFSNGSCRAWGWDNGDTFRVPLLKDVYLMAGQAETAGEFISESLPIPHHYHSFDIGNGENSAVNPDLGIPAGGTFNTNDAEGFSAPYSEGAKVRPDSVRYRAMVQLSTGATDEALMTCTGVLSDVADLKQTTLRTDQITNCITEIPQDIKLDINGIDLILKTGSKVYVSTNGTFELVNITNDVSGASNLHTPNGDRELFVCYSPSENKLITIPVLQTYSSTTAPTTFLVSLYAGWFDTSTNTVKYSYDGGATWKICSLPIAVGRPVSKVGWDGQIDQVFNGFGYIGSTVFALPGVKIQIPNGKNEDGTYANYIEEITPVKTYTFTSESGSVALYYDSDIQSIGAAYTGTYIYDSSTNSYVNKLTGLYVTTLINVANCICTSGKISSFKFADVDSVANSNASNFSQAGRSYLSGLGMPSGRYIDLTLGANGSSYTAPANGYFCISRTATAAGQVLQVEGNYNGFEIWSQGAQRYSLTVPVRKGASVKVYYTMPTAGHFVFLYAEGEN